MIKDSGIVREPRGLSWQNWATSCKDVIVDNARVFVIAGIIVLVAAGGSLLSRHNASERAKHAAQQTTPGTQLNLNDTSGTSKNGLPADTSVGSSATSPSISASIQNDQITNGKHASVVGTKQSASPVCNTGAAASARTEYNTGITAENSYHTAQLGLLGVTTTATSLLPISSKNNLGLQQEDSRHQSVLGSLKNTLVSSLNNLHCSL